MIGNDTDGDIESSLCPLDERVIDIELFLHASKEEDEDSPENHDACQQAAELLHILAVEPHEEGEEPCHESADDGEHEQDVAVEEVDALVDGDHDKSHDGGEHRGEQQRDEHIGGVGGSGLGPVSHDGDGYDGDARRVECQEHNHGVAGRVALCIDALQLLHGLQSHRSGGIVESEHVGRDVHEDGAECRMPTWYLGEQSCEHRTEEGSELIDQSAVFSHFQQSHPESKCTGESETHLKSIPRHLEGGVHHCWQRL